MINETAQSPVRTVVQRAAPGATVRIGPLSQIPDVLRILGCPPESVFANSGFALSYFDDPDLPIPYAAASRLIERCVAATGCEHFGLMVGQRSGASALGLAGFVMMNAPDVGGALGDLVRYLDLHDRGGVPTLETRNGTSLLGFAIVEPDTHATDQIYDLSMAVACNLMRMLCGDKWNPAAVLLPRRPPADASAWSRFFRAPLHFDAGQCALSFGSHWLAHQVPSANPALHRHLAQQADVLRNTAALDFPSVVRRTVSGTVASAQCTATNVARLLGMHERTLNRRLVVEGITFKRIQDDVRYATSRQLLENTALNLSEIAAALGYAEASAFIRAFARWSGTTPEQWRRAQHHRRAAQRAD